jgi:hypothetical protein
MGAHVVQLELRVPAVAQLWLQVAESSRWQLEMAWFVAGVNHGQGLRSRVV